MIKSRCKKFILRNFDKFEYDSKNEHFFLHKKNGYYTDITINLSTCGDDDRFYTVCYWGNRDSWLWIFREDFIFTENIIRKSKHTEIDTQIINILKAKKYYYENI